MSRSERWSPLVSMLLGWSGLTLGIWALSLLALQVLFGRQLDMLQTSQLGRELSLNIRLTELTLERYPPALIAELTGLELAVMSRPAEPKRFNPSLQRQMDGLKKELCQRLSHCPMLVPVTQAGAVRGVWIELISPLEPVWLRVGLRSPLGWPPEPALAGLALISAVVISGGLFLLMEVERPLRGLERALSRVGEGTDPDAVPAVGAPEVQRLTRRFNAMLERLAANRRDRATMLAGIAHDLRAPITRLRFRLSRPSLDDDERQRSARDLESLERITGQFLLFAGGGDGEDLVDLPLDQWLAEVSASHPSDQLKLELTPIMAMVKPVALGRAVANLIDNAFTYGTPPVTVRLRGDKDRCVIEVWDQGPGMPMDLWDQARQPFRRLDDSRGEQGHCGLGLAIVSHVVARHGGEMGFVLNDEKQPDSPGRFAVRLEFPISSHRTDQLQQH
ncbi:MAG: ATP-binding protein [Prochlorococcus sp.]